MEVGLAWQVVEFGHSEPRFSIIFGNFLAQIGSL